MTGLGSFLYVILGLAAIGALAIIVGVPLLVWWPA